MQERRLWFPGRFNYTAFSVEARPFRSRSPDAVFLAPVPFYPEVTEAYSLLANGALNIYNKHIREDNIFI
jgi:hypothetical protein